MARGPAMRAPLHARCGRALPRLAKGQPIGRAARARSQREPRTSGGGFGGVATGETIETKRSPGASLPDTDAAAETAAASEARRFSGACAGGSAVDADELRWIGEASSACASSSDASDDFAASIPYQCERDVGSLSVADVCASDEVYNVELSWLAFNWRVLAMARDERVPLLERLVFLGISSSNLDEFFAKRVGGLKLQVEAEKESRLLRSTNALRWSPTTTLAHIADNVKDFMRHQSRILDAHLLPALAAHHIHIVHRFEDLPSGEQARLRTYFSEELELLLTPIKLDPGHPFPFLPSLSLGVAVRLQDESEGADGSLSYAVVSIPEEQVPRWVPVSAHTSAPDGHGGGGSEGDAAQVAAAFIPVEQVIISNLHLLFGGWRIRDAWMYRVTRNVELERHEEEAEDLLEMISEEVRERMFAPFVRLEVQRGMPTPLVSLLTEELDLTPETDVYHIDSLLELADFKSLRIDAPHLQSPTFKFPRYNPAPFKGFHAELDEVTNASIFTAIRKHDILLHHPYESFESTTLRFLEEAASDPSVLAIKTTVYRTSSQSPVVAALLDAAEHGKQVAVLMELKARFEEERNVTYAQKLEGAGCSVAYGLLGLKTHCKITLVVRKEKQVRSGLRTYVHIGTGNYNPVTARLYTDFGILSW